MCRTISFHASCLIVCVPFFSTALAIARDHLDSANTVRNPDFNTVTPPGQSDAWKSFYFAENDGTLYCQDDGIIIKQNIAGHAQCVQLNSLYRYELESGAWVCSPVPPCDQTSKIQLVQLEQTGIPLAKSDYVEVAFDFLLENRMPCSAPSCWGEPSTGLYPIAAVQVSEVQLPDGILIGKGIGVGSIDHWMLSDVAPLNVWVRQRIGMRRRWTSSTLTLTVTLIPGAQTDRFEDVYAVAMNLDNVSVITFDASCEEQQWICEVGTEVLCSPVTSTFEFVRNRGVQTPIAVNDSYAPFQCIRSPCVCIADIDRNGIVNGGDLTYVLGGWGTTDPVPDLDHDGTVSGADLTLLLSQWGVCVP